MIKRSILIVLTAVFLMSSSSAWADRGDRRDFGRRDYHNRKYGHVVHRLPPGYRTIRYGGLSYLYCEGLFYRYTPAGYVIIEPPRGALVPSLPPGYTTVVVEHRPYYYYADTYYVPAATGYVVAEPTEVKTEPSPVPAAKAASLEDGDSFEIHIPNDNGSFTLVTLKKTEKGFLGPQGEFYNDHPTVEQLKERYIKK